MKKKQKGKKSIQRHIILFTVTLLMVVLVCEVFFNQFLAKKIFIAIQVQQMKNLFYEIQEGYTDDREELKNYLDSIDMLKNIKIQVASDSKIIYFSSYGYQINEPDNKKQILGVEKDNFSWEPKVSVDEKGIKSNWKLRLAGKFRYNGSVRYILILYHLNSIEVITWLFTGTSVVIAIVVMIAGLAAAIIYTNKMLRPLNEIEKAAQHISNLEFHYPVPAYTSITELDSLARSIHIMSDKLNQSILQLNENNIQLKKDVESQKQLEKMRREFISNVSHEMKTPLCLLLMYSENLKDNYEDVDREFYCDTIMEEVVRLDKMVKSLLDISSIENGLSKIQPEWFDFSSYMNEYMEKVKLVMSKAELSIVIENSIMVYGDQYYLEQAVDNYISNAVSHTEDGKKINISLSRQKEQTVFSVFNEGTPVPEEKIQYIWDSFYQTDTARSPQEGNHVGLGLYIVKTIINAHGGQWGVENMEDGVRFWFTL